MFNQKTKKKMLKMDGSIYPALSGPTIKNITDMKLRVCYPFFAMASRQTSFYSKIIMDC